MHLFAQSETINKSDPLRSINPTIHQSVDLNEEVNNMYRVVYQLPFNSIREIYMPTDELQSWLRWHWLRERIISYEEVVG
jgi:hypothetical protein